MASPRSKPGRRRGGGRAAGAPACATAQRSSAFDADTWQAALNEQLEALERAAGAHAPAAAACRLNPSLPAHPVRLLSSHHTRIAPYGRTSEERGGGTPMATSRARSGPHYATATATAALPLSPSPPNSFRDAPRTQTTNRPTAYCLSPTTAPASTRVHSRHRSCHGCRQGCRHRPHMLLPAAAPKQRASCSITAAPLPAIRASLPTRRRRARYFFF